jgi:alkylation response protein AidB-like acyl-CoA dehydrogenase
MPVDAATLRKTFVPEPYKIDSFADQQAAYLIEQVIALRPLLRSEMTAAEQQRSITAPVFEALDALGLWKMLVPRRWGGLGLSSTAMSQINFEIAKGDPAVAWVVQIINGTTWISSLTTDRLQAELFADGAPKICSSFAQPGNARPVEGGYIIDGTWSYNSGCRQASWGQYLVNITQPDGTVLPGNFAYVEMRDVEILDTWFCAGMQGTSSDSARIRELFVPEHRMVLVSKPFSFDLDTKKLVGEPCDYWPVFPLIRSAGLALLAGTAEAALELAFEGAKRKGVPNTSYVRQTDSPVIQRNLGEAAGKIRTAKILVETMTRTFDGYALKHEQPDGDVRARSKLDCSMTIELLVDAVNLIMNAAGSSAFMLSNPLQRFWRDLNVAARHAIYNSDAGFEIYGRSVLGVVPNIAPPNLI